MPPSSLHLSSKFSKTGGFILLVLDHTSSFTGPIVGIIGTGATLAFLPEHSAVLYIWHFLFHLPWLVVSQSTGYHLIFFSKGSLYLPIGCHRFLFSPCSILLLFLFFFFFFSYISGVGRIHCISLYFTVIVFTDPTAFSCLLTSPFSYMRHMGPSPFSFFLNFP